MRSEVLETGQHGLQISVPFVAGRETDKVMAKAHKTLQTLPADSEELERGNECTTWGWGRKRERGAVRIFG